MIQFVLPSIPNPVLLPGGTFITLLCLLPSAVLFLFLTSGLYNLYLHPLSKVPGPRIYAFSKIPHLYHMIIGDWHLVLKSLHDQYGPVVRFCPISVSFNTPDAFKQIYGHKGAGEKSFEKDREFYERIRSVDNIILADTVEHRRHRRLISHAFSMKALSNQEDILQQYATSFVSNLGKYSKQQGGVIDIVRWFNFATFDLIGDLSLGASFGCLDQGDYHPWVRIIFDNVRFVPLRYIIHRLNLVNLASLLIPAKFKKGAEDHHQFSHNTAMRRIEAGDNGRPDFMSYILRYNDERGMSREEISENINLLILAGSETTASLLSGVTSYLLNYPAVYNKLIKEIRSAFRSQEDITLARVNELQYMLAVLQEGLRIYPPVPFELPRRVPPGGSFISGYWLPEDTRVGISHWIAFKSASNFRDPDTFVPERWLDDPRYVNDKREMHNPFSVGPRNCVGHNLAHAQLRLFLAHLLWAYDLEPASNCENWASQRTFVLWEKPSLNVRLVEAARG